MFARTFLAGWLVIAVVVTPGFMDAGSKRSDSKVKIEAKSNKPGTAGPQTITITMDVEDSWYIYANPVGNEAFEPVRTQVKVIGKTGELDAKVDYPAGTAKKTGGAGYQTYHGKVTIPVHFVRPDSEPVAVSITLNACQERKDGTGLCLMTATVKLSVD